MPGTHFRKNCMHRHVFLDSREEVAANALLASAKINSDQTLCENYDEEDPHNDSKQGKASSGINRALIFL
jgi:hypothetical protein